MHVEKKNRLDVPIPAKLKKVENKPKRKENLFKTGGYFRGIEDETVV